MSRAEEGPVFANFRAVIKISVNAGEAYVPRDLLQMFTTLVKEAQTERVTCVQIVCTLSIAKIVKCSAGGSDSWCSNYQIDNLL